ncbi:hypothetical protein FKM82_010990 [Ascaphus truei]
MYSNSSEKMATARMEDPRGADSPKWRTEANGESAHGVCAGKEDMGQLMKRYFSLRQDDGEDLPGFLLRIGAVLQEMRKGDHIKATEVEVYFCDQILRGAIPDHPVVAKMRCSWMRGVPLSFGRLLGEIEEYEVAAAANMDCRAIQNGGSRYPGRPRGPVAENAANAKLAESCPGLAPKEEFHPIGDKGAKSEATPPRTVNSSAPVPGHPINLWDPPQIFTRGRGLYLCQPRPELSEGGAGGELPVPQLRAGEQERPLCKVSPVTSTTKSEMDIGVYPYLLPGGSLVVKAGADTAMLTAEAPRAACTEPVDPGEWGSLLMIRTEPEERGVYNRGENPEPHRRSPAGVPLPESEFGSSEEEQATLTTVVRRLPADHYSGAGKEPALTCVAAERSLVSPVQRQPERRSPTAVVTYSAEGGEDSIPSRRSGEIHPYPPQAPVVATAEEGLAQAGAERRAEPSLPAADVVVEEEIPLGDPSQDGGVSGSGDDVTSGGGSGTTRERTTTPRRSGSASRSPVSTQSWQAARRAETGEAQPAARPHNDTGLSEGRERVGTPRMPITCPYAQTHALDKAPVPVTFFRGSTSSLGMSGGSQGTGEKRTGERLNSYASDGGSRGGGQLGKVSESRWVPSVAVVKSQDSSKQERWSRPLSSRTSGTRWWAVGEFTPAQKKRKMQERWFQICQHNIEPMGPGILSDPVDTDEPLSWVLPGRAGNAELTRSSRAERAIIAKYKASHRLEYLYVPEPLMEGEIEFKMGSTGEDRGYGTDEEEGSGEEDWDPGGLHEKCRAEGYSIAALSPVDHAVRKPP